MTAIFPDDTEVERLLVGPDSVTWQYTSDLRLYSVMLYPLLLQVAHPTVGAGVRDFSDFERRPWNRLLRTIDYVSLLSYGGRDAAAAGRRLRALHKGFKGTRPDGKRYYALEPDAYAWVHATLLETYISGHAHFGRPMSTEQIARFYREYRGLGRLIGVREHDLPEHYWQFRQYYNEMLADQLVWTESVDRVLRSIKFATQPPLPVPDLLWRAIRVPARRALWLGGLGLMQPALRERLGVSWSRRDEREFQLMGTASRALTPLMPERLLVMGPAQLRMRRRAIARGPLGERAARVQVAA